MRTLAPLHTFRQPQVQLTANAAAREYIMKPLNGAQWYGHAMARYATFAGRSTRSEFWYFTLFSAAMGFAARLIDERLRTGGVLYLIVTLVHAIPSLSVFVRRLHDTSRTGWCFLAVFTVIGAIPLVVFACQRGTPGSNRFGAPLDGQGRPLTDEAPPELTAASSPARDPIGEVERLAELRAKGAISDAEFEHMKANVFGTAGASSDTARA